MSGKGAFRLAFWLVLAGGAAGVAVLVIMLAGSAGVRVVKVSPADGREDVPITAPIRISFAQAMDAAAVGAYLRIEPHVDGILVSNKKEVEFHPRGALRPDTTYTVTLQAGVESKVGRRLAKGRVWHFQTRAPLLLFLGRPYEGAMHRQLYVVRILDTGPAGGGLVFRQLTDHPQGVWDYAVHPQGEEIVFSALREDGGADLWRMDRDGADQRPLLACPEAACLHPVWSPDGRLLAYERRDIWAAAPNLDPKAGRIWLYDLQKGKERALFDYDVALHSPAWAPIGQRVAYVSPVLPGLEVYDLQSGELQQYGNEWGAEPVWSPEGDRLVVPELMLVGEAFVVHLARIDLESESMVDISDGEDVWVQDVAPAWSPCGGWIAFGRQFLDEERWTPGRQLWLTRPDGHEAHPLLLESMSDHFAFSWRPDGGALAYTRADLSEGTQPVPEVAVWVLNLEGRESRLVAEDAVLPSWLP